MAHKFLAGSVLAALVFLPIGTVNITEVSATDGVYQLAQRNNAYSQYMQLGYSETRRRNYRKALSYFQQAAQIRPGDKYATAAIRNVTGYIQRRRNNRIAFVPGRPGRVRSAATRGSCLQAAQAPIPIIPTDKEVQLTTTEHPTFFFYVPQTSAQVKALEFVLQEDDESVEPLYKGIFTPAQQTGILSITLPANQPPLTIGKEYTWGFSMVCDAQNRDQDVYIEGKIQRTEDENLAVQLGQTTTDLDRAVLFATAGFWEDALRTIATLRRQRPNDPEVKTYWDELLKSVEIQPEVINKPLLPCCTTPANPS